MTAYIDVCMYVCMCICVVNHTRTRADCECTPLYWGHPPPLRVMDSFMNESCHIWVISMSHVTHEWVMSHIGESCHIWLSHVPYEWVMSRMSESCHISVSHVTYQWVMSHMSESCHTWVSHVTYEWVMSHMNESCHIWVSHVTHETPTHMHTPHWMCAHCTPDACVCACHMWHDSLKYDTYYGVATVSRIDKITGLFRRISSLL